MPLPTNINDRCRLALYEYKIKNHKLSILEKLELRRLIKLYPDNLFYDEQVKEILYKWNYIETTGPDSYQDDNGNWVTHDKSLYSTDITTYGLHALDKGMISSETKSKTMENIHKWAPHVISTIALIISVIALFK